MNFKSFIAASMAATALLAAGLSPARGHQACNVTIKARPARAGGGASAMSVRMAGCPAGMARTPQVRCGDGSVHTGSPAQADGRTYRLQGCPAGDHDAGLEVTYN